MALYQLIVSPYGEFVIDAPDQSQILDSLTEEEKGLICYRLGVTDHPSPGIPKHVTFHPFGALANPLDYAHRPAVFTTESGCAELAFESGFSGQRAVQSWVGRVRLLRDLGFIMTKPGPSGELSYALILDPYLRVDELRVGGKVQEPDYNGLITRMSMAGAKNSALILTAPK